MFLTVRGVFILFKILIFYKLCAILASEVNCMNNILFEATFHLDIMFLIPVFMIIFILLFPKIWKNSWKDKYTIISYKIVKIFCGCAAAYIFVITLILAFSTVSSYKTTVVAYEKGEYEVVEGYVENFVPMPSEGMDESFEINGVKFSYSDYNITFGYNNAKSHGGVIEGNGQHLKIGYVIDNGENIIVCIEQLK